MAHSFNIVQHLNGNLSVEFIDLGKYRRIIFNKGTQALADFLAIKTHFFNSTDSSIGDDELIEDCIKYMRKRYVFKANANNVSVFNAFNKQLATA